MTDSRLPIGMTDPARRVMVSDVHKDYATIEKYSCETNGAYTRFRGGVKPGGGNPLHYHTLFTPTFTPVSGPLGFEIGGVIKHLKVGEAITVPVGVPHRFFNDSEGEGAEDCKFVLEIRPGNEGYEQLLTVMFGLANEGLCGVDGSPNDKTVLATILVMGDMWVPGMVGTVVNTVFRGLAAYKRWMGVEEKLLERYWFK